MVRFRDRIGEKGVAKIFKKIVDLAIELKMIEKEDLKEVLVDTTVMPKNIAYPTDSVLIDKCREKLVALSKKHDIQLRQNIKQATKRFLTSLFIGSENTLLCLEKGI